MKSRLLMSGPDRRPLPHKPKQELWSRGRSFATVTWIEDNVRCGVKLDKTHIEHNESALSPIADVGADIDFCRFGPCVDGSELARAFFTCAGLVGAAMCSAFGCGSHDRWP